jgi:hypothetical protein
VVDDVPLPTGEAKEARQLLGQLGEPAFVRRGRLVQTTYEQLLARCRQQRNEWLDMVRLRLGQLRCLAGDWDALAPLLTPDEITSLRALHDELQPALRLPPEPTTSRRRLRSALSELTESMERFNRRWQEYLGGVDLATVNQARADYNCFYVVEKECVVRSHTIARAGFRRLEPLTTQDLVEALPLLAIPPLR